MKPPTQVELENILFNIEGYYFPTPNQSAKSIEGAKEAFEKAKVELIEKLNIRIKVASSIDFEQFRHYHRPKIN